MKTTRTNWPTVYFHHTTLKVCSPAWTSPASSNHPLSMSLSSFSFLSQKCSFHLDWSVEHFVSLLSNHFKNTHTHPHTRTSQLLWRPNLLLCMRERERESLFWCSQIVFSSMPATFSADWVYKWPSSHHLGHALLFISFSFFTPVLVICEIFKTNSQLSHFLMTPCNTLSKPRSHALAPYFLSLFQRRVVINCFIPRQLQLILLQWG